MSPTVIALVVLAGLLQVGGLITTAVDLGQTWARQPGRNSLPLRIFGPALRFLWSKVFRRPWRREIHVGDAMGSVDVLTVAMGTSSVGLRTDAPVDEQLAQLKSEVDAAIARADQAHGEIAALRAALEEHKAATSARFDQARAELEDWFRRQAADGVPLAVVGLSVTALGTLLQLALELFS